MHARPGRRRSLALLLALALAAALAPVPPAAAAPSVPVPRSLPPRVAARTSAADSVIVQVSPDATPSAALIARAGSPSLAGAVLSPRGHGRALVRVRGGANAREAAARLARVPGVRWAVPNLPVHASSLPVPPNDPYYGAIPGVYTQRHYLGPNATYPYSIDLEPAWTQAFASSDHAMDLLRPGVTMALVDTGYTPNAETPAGTFVPAYDYIGGDTDTSDGDGHGTIVGNIMHAATGNGAGVAGTAYATPSQVLVYKVLDASGSGSMDDVMSAIRAAADRGARVINCSLGGPGGGDPYVQQAWDETIAYAASKGAVVVAAAGNEGGAIDFPAAAKGAIAVGSIDPATGLVSTFSDTGPQLALVAPGERVVVSTRDGSVVSGAGTSFASPLVAASVGMLWSLLPNASAPTITSAVLSTARDLGAAGFDTRYGNGELDVMAAYAELMREFPTQPSPAPVVTRQSGFAVTVSWPRLPGSDVVYHYGLAGGPTYSTTATSAELVVPGDGAYTAWVSASAGDMFSSAPSSLGFSVATGRPALTMQRYAGSDRYATAAAVSRAGYADGTGTVVIASGENFPDALSASVLAHRLDAPLLLTRTSSLPAATAGEIARLHPASAVIVGGPPAVSDTVAASVRGIVPVVTRIAGGDRYETAAKVALEVAAHEGGSIASGTVVIASGEDFPDALAASPMAGAAGYPVLLVRKTSMPAVTASVLRRLGATRTLVIGSPAAVSDAVAAQTPSPSRIGGADRYATSRAVADAAVAAGILKPADVGVATGRAFPDALAGGVLMAKLDGPIVLGDGTNTQLDMWMEGVGDTCTRLDVFGSDAVVPTPFATHLLAALRSR